jgi:hypothetical protein
MTRRAIRSRPTRGRRRRRSARHRFERLWWWYLPEIVIGPVFGGLLTWSALTDPTITGLVKTAMFGASAGLLAVAVRAVIRIIKAPRA